MMSQVEGFAHDAAAVKGDTPATGAWDFGDQTVSAEAAKDAADFGASFLGSFPHFRKWGVEASRARISLLAKPRRQ